jgi:adenylate kinase
MHSEVAFVGGIHGVGKSTICQQMCRELNFQYLSASELLKWKDINDDSKNKKVNDIPDTQNRLVIGLSNIVQKGKYYLLDGHYCLLDSNNEIKNVPIQTFNQINPFSLNLIFGDISVVKKRLEERDRVPYKYELLERLQAEELAHAKFLSKTLGITLNVGTQNDYSELLFSLASSSMPNKTKND